jgi:hypothetical protein
MLGKSSVPVKRRGKVIALAAGLLSTLGVVSTPGTAHADVVLRLNYPVTGTTYIKSTDSSMSLGPGTLAATLDENANMTGHVSLPPAAGSFKEFGVIPVTVTTEFIEAAPTTGTVNINTGAVQATSHFTLRLKNLRVAGIPTPVGDHCETETPANISVVSDENFNVLTGGNLSGTYTIPKFEHCLLATPLINLTVPGPGNTITLTLGAATVPPS